MAARGRRGKVDLKTITIVHQLAHKLVCPLRESPVSDSVFFLSCFDCLFFPQSIRFSNHDCAVISGTWHGSALTTVIDFVYVCIFRYIQ